MADGEDRESKTEEPTPRHLSKLREEGKVIKSPDVNAAAVLIGAAIALAASSSMMAAQAIGFMHRMFRLEDRGDPLRAVAAIAPVFMKMAFPVILTAMVAAIAVSLAQTQGLFSLKILEFKLENLNPFPRLKTVLPSKQTIGEILKSLAKMIAVGVVVYSVLEDEIPVFATLPSAAPAVAAAKVGQAATRLAIYAAVAFAAVAALDWWYQWYRFRKDAMMSKQDIKDEMKEGEGDPTARRRVRQKMNEMGRRRAIAEVGNATVVVANPTHISVALRYKPEEGDVAPVMLASGVDDLALRMRAEARRHGVPIIENRPLARALHARGKIGLPIPVELYKAAATVIAHVMRLRGGLA